MRFVERYSLDQMALAFNAAGRRCRFAFSMVFAVICKPLLDELRIWLDQHIPIVPPRSALGKAMNYTHKQWPKLTVFIEDGRLRMDYNLVENAIRPIVIGRKNFLFCDTVAGANANASANLYSLIETAKANGIEPYAYLRTVFSELPADDDSRAKVSLSAARTMIEHWKRITG